MSSIGYFSQKFFTVVIITTPQNQFSSQIKNILDLTLLLCYILGIKVLFNIFCFMSIFKNKFFFLVVFVVTFVAILSSVLGFNSTSKIANATIVGACSAGELLEGGNCVFTKVASSQYETKCTASYSQMDAVCVKFNAQTCSYFAQGLIAENGLCKLDLSKPVYGTEISDNDGRQCNGVGTNFKRYSVGLPSNSNQGSVVCGNTFSLLDKSTFRFLPNVVTEINNLVSVQSQNTYSSCPSGYLELVSNKCSRPSIAQSCNGSGEVLVSSICIPCPAGQYCPSNGVVTKLVTVCASGGTLSSNQCIAPIKYSATVYTDGCPSGYAKKDQSCAIVENRTHDLGCSYFYSSEKINVTAVQGSDGYCSTGGRVDFASAGIVRVSDFNCNGVGTYYYNYNVAYDPLVCGNDYSFVGKAGFKWLPDTFKNITALQKIPSLVPVCPPSWVSFDNSNNCSQAPIVQEYSNSVDCPINTYCLGSNIKPSSCPAGTTSQVRSIKVSDCISIICNNRAVNPPACNQCSIGLQLINNSCLPSCPSGVNRDIYNICTICINGGANPSSGCNACPSGYQYNGSNCTLIVNIICKNGFEISNNTCVCISPKIIIKKPTNNTVLYEQFCQNQVLSSSSSSSIISFSSLATVAVATNNGGAVIINNNNPTTNNNNSVNSNNVVNNYQAATPLSQPNSKASFIPIAAPANPVIYYQSPVANITETIRSGGFNIILIISALVAISGFGLIFIRGKRNQNFGNYTFINNIDSK